MVFVPAQSSPNGQPMLIVANELSGTTTMYEVRVTNTIPAPSTAPTESTISGLSEQAITTATDDLEPGASITAAHGGFIPFENVQLIVASNPTVLATATADASGEVTISGNLPQDLSSGSHTLALFAPVSGIGVRAPFSVAPPATTTTTAPATTTTTIPRTTTTTVRVADASTTTVAVINLPETGSDPDQLPFAIGLMALGLALVVIKRRRVI
jgi:LPXTG-motif cell wall-anchored protein